MAAGFAARLAARGSLFLAPCFACLPVCLHWCAGAHRRSFGCLSRSRLLRRLGAAGGRCARRRRRCCCTCVPATVPCPPPTFPTSTSPAADPLRCPCLPACLPARLPAACPPAPPLTAAAGLFATKQGVEQAYHNSADWGVCYGGSGYQLGIQLLGGWRRLRWRAACMSAGAFMHAAAWQWQQQPTRRGGGLGWSRHPCLPAPAPAGMLCMHLSVSATSSASPVLSHSHALTPPSHLPPPAGMVCIFAWSAAINGALFLTLRRIGWLRASKEDEIQGLDYSQVGGWVAGWLGGWVGGWLGRWQRDDPPTDRLAAVCPCSLIPPRHPPAYPTPCAVLCCAVLCCAVLCFAAMLCSPLAPGCPACPGSAPPAGDCPRAPSSPARTPVPHNKWPHPYCYLF